MDTALDWVVFLKRLPSLFLGLFLFSLGIVAILQSNLGMMPWGVLNVGLAKVTPFTIGQASQIIGLLVIIISYPLGFTPGLGTLANMFFVGYFMDLIIWWNLIPMQTELPGQLVLLLLSVMILGFASLLYLRVQLGAGPRDGLMLGVIKKLDKPVAYVRAAIEVAVLTLGFLMGGPVGIGTVVSALTVGISVQFFFKLGHFNGKSSQIDLLQLYRFLKKPQKPKSTTHE
ncbi:MAG TPA: membrane protein [Candidatus Bathyarchaeia archaeon]|nr:MAG: hypothetical protein A3K70_00035 [Candidatus Bathyarchaeota archaeon RBG_16_48_13]HJX24020.1 membrane protein [Candidatus Bathyarchaeia archaeon]